MSTLPPIQRLVLEDFPTDERKWLGKLLQPVNQFFESVYSALNRNLSLADNLSADVRTVELDGQFPLKLAWTLKSKPAAVLVGDVYRTDGTTITLSAAVFVQWQFNQSSQLQIDGVVGITPSGTAKYKVSLVSFTG